MAGHRLEMTFDGPEQENSGKYHIVTPQWTHSAYLEADRLIETSTFPALPCDAVTWMDTDGTYHSGG